MTDGKLYPVSKTFYYNSVNPKEVVNRFYAPLKNRYFVGVVEKHEQTKVRPVATV